MARDHAITIDVRDVTEERGNDSAIFVEDGSRTFFSEFNQFFEFGHYFHAFGQRIVFAVHIVFVAVVHLSSLTDERAPPRARPVPLT